MRFKRTCVYNKPNLSKLVDIQPSEFWVLFRNPSLFLKAVKPMFRNNFKGY